MLSLQRVAVSAQPLVARIVATAPTTSGRGRALLCCSLQEEVGAAYPQKLPVYTVAMRANPKPDLPFPELKKIFSPVPTPTWGFTQNHHNTGGMTQ